MTQGSGSKGPNEPFEYDGAWHVYDQAGRLLRWNGATQMWTPVAPAAASQEAPTAIAQPYQQAPAAQPYQAYPQPAQYGYAVAPRVFASLSTPAMWCYILLGAAIVASLVYLAGGAMMVSAAGTVVDSTSFTELANAVEDAENADDVIAAGQALSAIATIATAIVFIWWTRRATCNVTALGAANPQFSPGWAVGWWFIPFANLVMPLLVLGQAWKASDPNFVRSGNPLGWRSVSMGGILIAWWVVWIVSGITSAIASSAYDAAEAFDAIRDASTVIVIAQLITVAAAVLAMVAVRKLTQRQELAAQLRRTAQ